MSQSLNTSFTRALLTAVVPAVEVAGHYVFRDAMVTHFHRDHYEFAGPHGFHWHGHAHDLYEARYKGWMAYLKANHRDLWAKIEAGQL